MREWYSVALRRDRLLSDGVIAAGKHSTAIEIEMIGARVDNDGEIVLCEPLRSLDRLHVFLHRLAKVLHYQHVTLRLLRFRQDATKVRLGNCSHPRFG